MPHVPCASFFGLRPDSLLKAYDDESGPIRQLSIASIFFGQVGHFVEFLVLIRLSAEVLTLELSKMLQGWMLRYTNRCKSAKVPFSISVFFEFKIAP